MIHDPRRLSYLYGATGALGAGFALFYVHVLTRLSAGGPASVGVALIAVTLLLLQALPCAGLLALVLRSRGDRPWPKTLARMTLVLALVLAPLAVLLFGLPAAVLAACVVAVSFAKRLARVERRWVIAWATLCVACFTLDVMALLVWFHVRG